MNIKVKQILDFSKSAIDPNMSTFDWGSGGAYVTNMEFLKY